MAEKFNSIIAKLEKIAEVPYKPGHLEEFLKTRKQAYDIYERLIELIENETEEDEFNELDKQAIELLKRVLK